MSSNKHSLAFYFSYDEGSGFSVCSWGKAKEAPVSRETGMLRGPADRDGPQGQLQSMPTLLPVCCEILCSDYAF